MNKDMNKEISKSINKHTNLSTHRTTIGWRFPALGPTNRWLQGKAQATHNPPLTMTG